MIKLHWNLAETLKDKKKTVKKLAKETSRCENTILKLKNDSYCLKNSRITYSDRKKPLELTIFYYPPEKAKFEMILPRRDRNILLRVK